MNPTDQASKMTVISLYYTQPLFTVTHDIQLLFPTPYYEFVWNLPGKEQRRKELKKNKKQRIAVRQAVLKGKDAQKIITDLDEIDDMGKLC